MNIYQRLFKLWSGQGIASETIKGKTGVKARVVILYATHRTDLFYMAVKYHDDIPKGIQVIERTENCI